MDTNLTTDANDQRIALVVLGMHRSGTSALSGVLARLGADLPATVMPAHDTNPKGFYESLEIMKINDEILKSAGSSWSDWERLNPDWFASAHASGFRPRAQAVLDHEFGSSSMFILKDPRICRLFGFWAPVLLQANIRPLILHIHRNPLEVAASLRKRDGFDEQMSQLIWLQNVLCAERDTRHIGRIFVAYDQLMSDWSTVAKRIIENSSLNWPRQLSRVSSDIADHITPQLRHHLVSDSKILNDVSGSHWISEAYKVLQMWSHNSENTDDYDTLDRIRRDFEQASSAIRPLTVALLNKERVLDASLTENAELQCSVAELSKEIVSARTREDKLNSELQAAVASVVTFEGEISRLQDKELRVFDEVLKREGEIQALREHCDALDQELRSSKESRSHTVREIEALNQAVVALENELSLRSQEAATAIESNNQLTVEFQGSLKDLQLRNQAVQEKYEQACRSLQELSEHEAHLNDKTHHLQSALDQRLAELKDLYALNDELGSDLARVQSSKDRLQKQFEQQKKINAKLSFRLMNSAKIRSELELNCIKLEADALENSAKIEEFINSRVEFANSLQLEVDRLTSNLDVATSRAFEAEAARDLATEKCGSLETESARKAAELAQLSRTLLAVEQAFHQAEARYSQEAQQFNESQIAAEHERNNILAQAELDRKMLEGGLEELQIRLRDLKADFDGLKVSLDRERLDSKRKAHELAKLASDFIQVESEYSSYKIDAEEAISNLEDSVHLLKVRHIEALNVLQSEQTAHTEAVNAAASRAAADQSTLTALRDSYSTLQLECFRLADDLDASKVALTEAVANALIDKEHFTSTIAQYDDERAQLIRARDEMAVMLEAERIEKQRISEVTDTLEAAKQKTESELAATHIDLSNLHSSLDDSLYKLGRAHDDTALILRLMAASKKFPFWWKFLPEKFRIIREMKRYKSERLFDYEGYFRNNPDVKAAGFKALDHYLLHGRFEGRSWN